MSWFDRLPWIGRVADRLKQFLLSRVVWITQGRQSVLGLPQSGYAFVAVLGREHYREWRKVYPVSRLLDAWRLARFERRGRPLVLFDIGPVLDNHREVIFFEVESSAPVVSFRALFWVPESRVIASALTTPRFAHVRREQLEYCTGAGGVSQVLGGVVRTPELFSMASGLPTDGKVEYHDEQAVREALVEGIPRLGVQRWASFLGPEVSDYLRQAARPAGLLVVFFLVAYVGLSSLYLWSAESLRTRELDELGPQVASLLTTQRKVDSLVAERAGLDSILLQRRPVWPVWEVLAESWRQGAGITNFSLSEGELTLRGQAPAATKVLQGLSELPGVSEARFQSAVRRTGPQEEFIIRLKMTSAVDNVR